MIITIDQLKGIAGAGGGLSLDASTMTFNQIRDLCIAAEAGGATVSLKALSGFTAGQLQELAQLAPGLVSFDLTG